MRIVASLPRRVREIENVWIPMRDGVRLAARLWLPEGAEAAPVPAILEYIPYRKRDNTRWRDEPIHGYFAGHGYASVRVDVRGSGDSGGLLLDEYSAPEIDDGVRVIEWIASQRWCSGAVGMIGKSWGGFNALQIAAREPEPLRAVVALCASDDRYADDAHYMGGCLLNENLIWGSVLMSIAALPPDPEITGAGWREAWLERLDALPLYPAIWMDHPRRDDYWKRGSVCEDLDAIRCPVYAISGWADGYSNAVPRLLSGLRAPAKGLIGPWAHLYPHQGVPGPAIGFLQEALRWWERWLKGIDNGIMDEPAYRVWMQESVPPRPHYETRPGRWVAERAWPSPRVRPARLAINAGGLGTAHGPARAITHLSPQTAGLASGSWCGFGAEGEMPLDQREEAGKSLLFESEPLEEGLEILGAPVIRVALAVDRPRALLAARLNDVAPDGSSTRVTYGLLNLAHRGSHERPEPMRPGRRVEVTLRLNDVAHSFPTGHRIRLAISTSYWPLAWPSPEPATLTLHAGAGFLELPVRPPGEEDARLRPFEEPEGAPSSAGEDHLDEAAARAVTRDVGAGTTVVTMSRGADASGEPVVSKLDVIGLETGHAILERYEIRDGDPLSATAEILHKTITRRGGWSVSIRTRVRLTSTQEAFRMEGEMEAREGPDLARRRAWEVDIPRDLL